MQALKLLNSNNGYIFPFIKTLFAFRSSLNFFAILIISLLSSSIMLLDKILFKICHFNETHVFYVRDRSGCLGVYSSNAMYINGMIFSKCGQRNIDCENTKSILAPASVLCSHAGKSLNFIKLSFSYKQKVCLAASV